MEVTRKGLVIIGIITVTIISGILFFTDMYISKLDEQARENLFNPNITMTDNDIFHTPPSELTEEQKARLYEISDTDSTSDEDIELARRANDMLMKTMTDEEAEQFAQEWVDKRTVEVDDVETTIDESKIVGEQAVPVDNSKEKHEYTADGFLVTTGLYRDASTDEVHDKNRNDIVIDDRELAILYNLYTDELRATIPMGSPNPVEEVEESEEN